MEFEVGLKCAAPHSGSSDGRYYPVEIIAISTKKSHAPKPIKVHFVAFGVHQWKGVTEVRLLVPVPEPPTTANAEAKPELARQETRDFQDLHFTFATSNYKQLLTEVPASEITSEEQVEEGLRRTLQLLAKQPGAEPDYARVTETLLASIVSIRRFMIDMNVKMNWALQSERTKFVAKMLWTAPILTRHPEMCEMDMDLADVRDVKFNGEAKEFCWILNMIIRVNERELLEAAWPIIQALNKFVVHARVRGQPRMIWPEDNILYRGAGFNMAFQGFFQPGKSFRTVGFLACTTAKDTAEDFLDRIALQYDPIMWILHIDGRKKCLHVNFMDASQVVDNDCVVLEEEYLFAPFSAFTVLEARWKEKATTCDPHEIELDVFPDNRKADENLPLAPWQ